MLKKLLDNIDRPLAVTALILVVFGLLMLSSAASGIGLARFGDSYFFVKRQFIYGVVPGIIGLIFALTLTLEQLRRYSVPFFITIIVLLVAVLIPGIGQSYGGAQSWLAIGPISFQPSEFLKLALVMYLSAWLSVRGEVSKDLKQGFVIFGLITGLAVGLVLLQPDVGTATIVAMIAVGMYFFSGAPYKYMVAILGAAGMGLFALILAAPYRFARITTFLNPDLDPQGAGYQIKQAFIAIGSGGWLGRGFGLSRAKFQYLPEAAGDSIFAIAAEELGFVIAVIIVLLFAYFFWRGLVVAERVKDPFGQLLIVGILIWVCGQSFINIGAMVGVFPLTGIPLPFISYGGTSLAALLTSIGIMLNISRQAK